MATKNVENCFIHIIITHGMILGENISLEDLIFLAQYMLNIGNSILFINIHNFISFLLISKL